MIIQELTTYTPSNSLLLSYDRLKADIWAAPLTIADHVKRERLLRRTPFAKKGLRIFTVSKEKKVLGGLELWPIEILKENKIQKGYIVACIVVDKKCRRQGIGSFLIREVIEILKTDKKTHFAVLYSEIGESYYASFGFQKTLFYCWEFDLQKTQNPFHENLNTSWLKPLSRANAINLWQKNRRKKILSPRLVPNANHFDWHLKRSDFYESKLKGQKNNTFGLQWPGGHLLWIADYKYNRLRILEMRGTEGLLASRARAIEATLFNLCRKLNLTGITIWDGAKNRASKIFESQMFSSECTNEDQVMVLSLLTHVPVKKILVERMSWV